MIQKYKLPLIFATIAVLYPAACILYGDLIPAAAGLGWDGVVWAAISQDLATHLLNNRSWDAYTFQHLLICFVLRAVYWLIAQFSTTFAAALKVNDIAAFAGIHFVGDLHANATIGIASSWVVNSVCLVTSIFLWARILERFAITGAVALLSYFMLFVNVANLKMPAFYVPLNDTLLLFCGVTAIYLYLGSRRTGLMGLGVASGFVRPGLPELAALLLIFPRMAPKAKSSSGHALGYVAAGLAGSILAAGVAYYILTDARFLVNDPEFLHGPVALRWLSGAIVCAYVTVGLYFLFRRVAFEDAIPKPGHVLSGLAVVASVMAILWVFAPGPTAMSQLEFFRRGILTGSALPGISLVSHVVYFGPGILLVILLWPKVADAAAEVGTGFVAVLALGVCLSIFSESRAITQYIPAFILALTLALAGTGRLPQWGFAACGVLCILFSKVWMQMAAVDPFFDGPQTPMQRYFMNSGPWMSPKSYLVQSLAILAASGVLIGWFYGSKIQEKLKHLRVAVLRKPGGRRDPA
jgi:hypothetical protein